MASNAAISFAEENLPLLTAVQNSLHAHALLRRDVDYLVQNGAIESVDEFKGRIVQNRRWPADSAYGHRGEGRCCPQSAGQDSWLHHHGESAFPLPQSVRHDGDRRHTRRRSSSLFAGWKWK